MKMCNRIILVVLILGMALSSLAKADSPPPETGASNQTSNVDSSSIDEWLKKKKRS